MKTYILQKDLPGAKAGTESEYTGCGYKFYIWHYSQQDIDDSPDFFKLKEDDKKIEFKLMYIDGVADGGILSKPLSNDQWLAVKSAIESVLNDVNKAPATVQPPIVVDTNH